MINFYDKVSSPSVLHSYDRYGEQIKTLKEWRNWSKTTKLDNVIHLIVKHPNLTAEYAQLVLDSRWYEYEHVIMEDPNYIIPYAMHVIGGRWKEAEKKFMESYTVNQMHAVICYAEYVIKGRWLEIEHLYKEIPWWSCIYAVRVMKTRWIEMEPIIQTNVVSWYNYSSHFMLPSLFSQNEVD